MPERTSYTAGTPSWVDLGTPDPEAAKRLYADLFGWTYEGGGAEAGHYAMCLKDGLPVAGISPQMDPADPPKWSTYLASNDLDGTTARIAGAGGRLLFEPMDIFDAGRMVFAVDPAGSPFGVWQARAHPGARRVNEVGALIWNDVQTRDGDATDRFYADVFGYALEPMGEDYMLYKLGDQVIGGRYLTGGEGPTGWLAYFAVVDTDAAVATVTGAGGQVTTPAHDSGYGRIAVVRDPWGATFGVISVPDETQDEREVRP
jgi:predicted enzyme related to lactoylglutathione lyase